MLSQSITLHSSQNSVKTLISQFQQFRPQNFVQTTVVKHSIDTGDHPPIKQFARGIPFALTKVTEEMVEDMLQQGVIKESVLGQENAI